MMSKVDREKTGQISYNDFLFLMLGKSNSVLHLTVKFEELTQKEKEKVPIKRLYTPRRREAIRKVHPPTTRSLSGWKQTLDGKWLPHCPELVYPKWVGGIECAHALFVCLWMKNCFCDVLSYLYLTVHNNNTSNNISLKLLEYVIYHLQSLSTQKNHIYDVIVTSSFIVTSSVSRFLVLRNSGVWNHSTFNATQQSQRFWHLSHRTNM